MRKIFLSLSLALLALVPTAAMAQEAPYVPTEENLAARKAFADRRFGIFLHWGLYSLFAQGEWYMTNLNIDSREYAKAAQAFYPHRFDAQAWVKAIKNAGAGYLCFTSRHHDGFSMWNTRQSDYNIMNTPYGKDVLKMLADACHEQGLGFHLYYSHIDWTRTDYPVGRTGRGTRRTLHPDWQSYYAFMNAQLTELLTQYGKVDCIWFDGVWDHDQDSVPFDWQLRGQYDLIHRLQPACLVGNNHHLTPFAGEDIQIFERDVPGENRAGLSGQEVSRLPLETCQTMNGMWGYKIVDQNYKTTTQLIRLLARTASKGANLLLNVGPQPDGCMPEAALVRLEEMGAWLRKHGAAIYKTDGLDYAQGGDSIVCTQTEKEVFLHVLSPTVREAVDVPVPLKRVREATVWPSGEKVAFRRTKKGITLTGINVPQGCPDHIIRIR